MCSASLHEKKRKTFFLFSLGVGVGGGGGGYILAFLYQLWEFVRRIGLNNVTSQEKKREKKREKKKKKKEQRKKMAHAVL